MIFLRFPKKNRYHEPEWTGVFSLVFCWMVIALTLSCTDPAATGSSTTKQVSRPVETSQGGISTSYQDSSSCRNCHAHIYEQFKASMHAMSSENPLFRAEFFNILLPRAEGEDLSGEMNGCIACHSPVTFMQTGGKIISEKGVNQEMSGVECDLCHTISGFKGSRPEGGNYISRPSAQKFGPFQYKSDHHRVYSKLQTKSEMCAICHNRTNRYGLEIISTYSEWRKSPYAEKGIECQDCHMNVQGFLTAGEAMYEGGTAAQGTLIRSKNRDRLYTHRFPGAHSEAQVNGAIQLDIQVDGSTVAASSEIIIYVEVDNSRSDHKLPTGSAELRLLYLDLVAEVGGEIILLSTNSLDREKYDVSGKGKFDATVLGDDVPAGSRVYRAVCIDKQGQQTLFSFDAVKIVFDNRLQANEIRKEFFTFQVPDDVGSEFFLIARLKYLRYPGSFAEKLGVPKVEPVELASVRQEVVLIVSRNVLSVRMNSPGVLFRQDSGGSCLGRVCCNPG